MRAGSGAPGIDRTTLDRIENEYGAPRLVEEPAAELRKGRYRPLTARGVMIPKPGRLGASRPLAIAAVRDRIVRTASEIVREPVFSPCGFGFRPKPSAHDALPVVIGEAWRGRRWVVPVRQIPRAGVMSDGQMRREVTGAALARSRLLLADFGLEPKEARTAITHLEEDGTRLDLLGFSDLVKRLALFGGERHERGRRYGLNVVACRSPDRCGLISLSGTVIPPRAGKPWRAGPNAAGERRR